MATFDFTENAVFPLGGGTASTSTLWANTDVRYTVAVGGIPFLLSNSEKFPYTRQTAQVNKSQVDTSTEPGEQSFQEWWIRSQASFHGGAGIKYYEPGTIHAQNLGYGDTGTSPIRYWKSMGVDVWTEGQVTLLPDTTNVHTLGGTTLLAGYNDGTDKVLVANGTNVYRHDGTTPTAATWGGTGSVLSMCSDGSNAYIADSTSIYTMPLVSGAGTASWTTGSSNVVVGFVKQRLVAGIDNKVYELTGAGPTLPTPVFTHPNASWKWTSFTEGPGAIYAAGYAGANSAVFAFTLDTTGVMPTLSAATVAADLPEGEVCYSIFGYLNSYIAFGTNRGVRVGLMDPSGQLQYGPLTVETTQPVRAFTAKDRFIYAGVEDDLDGVSGLVRIDLGTETVPGRYAWAFDLASTSTSPVTSVVQFGTSGRVAFSAGNVYLEHATNLATTGYLETGQIRYKTLEAKQFYRARIRGTVPAGSLVISSVQLSGNLTTLATYDVNTDLAEEASILPETPVESMGFRIDLNPAVDQLTGPTLYGYQIRALPVTNPGQELDLPVLLFDFEKDEVGVKAGREGWAYERWTSLAALVSSAGTVMYQDLRTGEAKTAVVRQVRMQQVATPAGTSRGFGGIAYITVKTLS